LVSLAGPLRTAAYERGLPQKGQNMRWRATMCCARISLSHRGERRSGSKTREVRPSRCEADTSCTSIAKRCASVQTGLAAPRSVSQRDSLASARKPRKRDNYALGASRQMSGRRKISRWRRQAGADRPVCEPFSSWSQTGQERQMRRNAEGVRPVALLKAVAKC
jgi:hypothetical protein